MASYTTNLNLKKPAGSENVAIGDINNNMDAIDQAYGTTSGQIANTLNPALGKTANNLIGSSYSVTDVDNAPFGLVFAASNAQHNPENGWATILTIRGNGDGYRQQIAIAWVSGAMFVRIMWNNTWGSWKTITMT